MKKLVRHALHRVGAFLGCEMRLSAGCVFGSANVLIRIMSKAARIERKTVPLRGSLKRPECLVRGGFPETRARDRLGSHSVHGLRASQEGSKRVQTGEPTPVKESHSANTSCSILNVALSVFAETTPSFFASRVLSTART